MRTTFVVFFATDALFRLICEMEGKKKLNRIKEILAREDRTTIWLAEQIGKSRTVVSNYVNNNTQPSVEVLYAIAKALNVNPKDLLNS